MSLPHSYARVLFDLASKAGKLSAVNSDIYALGLLCQKMHSVFMSIDNQASVKTKDDFLETLFASGKFQKETNKFLELLRIENKLSLLSDVSKLFLSLYRQDKKMVIVGIRTVKKLTKSDEMQIQQILETALKQKVVIDNKIDESIMGGMVIEIGSYVIDSSFLNKIRRLKLAVDAV